MSPHRDPETGQFVSGSDHGICFEELDLVHGEASFRVDAADWGGTESETALYDGAAQVADFGEMLDDFDVAEVVWLWFTQRLSAPTTSTAEGYVISTSQLRTEPGFNTDIGSFQALAGADDTEDTVDAKFENGQDNETLLHSVQAATDSHRDTAAGTGGGSDIDRVSEQLHFRSAFGGGPVFDEDDELYANVLFETDNVDDHRTLLQTGVTMAVKTWDVDECPVMSSRRR